MLAEEAKEVLISDKAFKELKAVCRKEYGKLPDVEIREIGRRLLRLFHILSEPTPDSPRPRLSENEGRALDFIKERMSAGGRMPSARQVARAVGLRSSRSGHRLIQSLLSKGIPLAETDVNDGRSRGN